MRHVEVVDSTKSSCRSRGAYAQSWWMFLVAGIIWLLLGFVILSTRPSSISVTVILIALAFFIGGLHDVRAGLRDHRRVAVDGHHRRRDRDRRRASPRWCGRSPRSWCSACSSRGTCCSAASSTSRSRSSNTHVRGWWLGLIAGIVAIGLGAWAIGNPERSTLLLITIIGIWTIFKGVFDLVAAFHYRDMKKACSR